MDQEKLNKLSARAHSLNFSITETMIEISDQRQEIADAEKRLAGHIPGNEHRELTQRVARLKHTLKSVQGNLVDLQTQHRETIQEIEKEITS